MISDSIGDFIDFIIGIGPWAWATGVLLVVVLALAVAFVKTRRGDEPAEPKRERHPEDILTIVAAGIATAVSAQGMWQFFERVLGPGTLPNGKLDPDNPGVHWPLRLLLFAFIEVAMVTSAYRARRSMSERHHAGVDGLAVWALTCLSAVLSTLEARSFAEHVFRLAAPLVAAWLWERGMAIQRVRLTGRGRINWRLTPERIFVRLGLAEASERTAGEVDATRRLTKVALAAGRYDDARWKVLRSMRARALKRKGRAMLARTAVATDPLQREYLRAVMAVDRHITRLPEAAGRPFWEADLASITVLPVADESTTERALEKNTAATITSTPASTAAVDDEYTAELADDLSEDSADDLDPARDRPDERDNRIAEKWIRERARGGWLPTLGEVADKYGFSRTWARSRVQAARARMELQGYRFLPGNVVQAPAGDASITAVNGSPAALAGDTTGST